MFSSAATEHQLFQGRSFSTPLLLSHSLSTGQPFTHGLLLSPLYHFLWCSSTSLSFTSLSIIWRNFFFLFWVEFDIILTIRSEYFSGIYYNHNIVWLPFLISKIFNTPQLAHSRQMVTFYFLFPHPLTTTSLFFCFYGIYWLWTFYINGIIQHLVRLLLHSIMFSSSSTL